MGDPIVTSINIQDIPYKIKGTLYDELGNNTDGGITQAALTNEFEEIDKQLHFDNITIPVAESVSYSGYPSKTQVVGQTITIVPPGSTTYNVKRYEIPANCKVQLDYLTTGNYGFVLTDSSDIVKEFVTSTDGGSHEFAPISSTGYIHALLNKVVKIEVINSSETIKERIETLMDADVIANEKITSLIDDLSEEEIGTEITPTTSYPQYCTNITTTNKISTNQDFTVLEYALEQGTTKVAITGKQPNNSNSPIMICFDSSNQDTAIFGELGIAYEEPTIFEIPSNTIKIYVEGSTTSASCRNIIKLTKQFYSKSESDAKYLDKESTSSEITKDVTNNTDIYQQTGGFYVYGTQTKGSQVNLKELSSSSYRIYDVPANTKVILNIIKSGSYGMALTTNAGIVIDWCNSGSNDTYTFAAQNTDCKLYASTVKIISIAFVQKISKFDLIDTNTENIAELQENISNIGHLNYWNNKSIWWCGTSIPAGKDSTLGTEETVAGNYPKEVGINLNATVFNESVGSSMCRANVRTGDYVSINKDNCTSCLSRTKQEIENIINGTDANFNNTGFVLDNNDIARLRVSSFEDKLMPYLEGTVTTKNPNGLIPDLFVIDHGHNDFKTYYKLSDDTPDIILEPTVENISNSILAEDSFMTANNYERLAYFLNIRNDLDNTIGDGAKLIQRVGESNIASFAASLNRNCYIGSINFIVTVILSWKPKARIVFISNYEYENGDRPSYSSLISAQESIAKSWAFPLCEVYKYLGFSNHIIPTAKEYFLELYPSSQGRPSVANDCIDNNTGCNVFRLYNQDGVHPHLDISGDANKVYAGIISEFIKTCR